MPREFFVAPYQIERDVAGMPSRASSLNHFAPQVLADGGHIATAEIDGDQQLCYVRASAKTLADLALAFTLVSNPATLWTPTRGTLVIANGELVPHPSRRLANKSLIDFQEEVLSDVEASAAQVLLDGYLTQALTGKVRLPKDLRPALLAFLLQNAGRLGFGLDKISTGTFPTQGVLDNFNRADAATLGANWSGNLLYQVVGSVADGTIVSNECVGTGTDAVALSYTTTDYGPDSESYFTLPATLAGDTYRALLRVVQPGTATADGYNSRVAPTTPNNWRLYILTNGVHTQLGSEATTGFTAGDKLGCEIIGSSLSCYQFTGGAWSQLLNLTDTTYSAAGRIGMYIPGTTAGNRIEDFGGGTIPGPPVNPTYFDFPKQKLREAKAAGRI